MAGKDKKHIKLKLSSNFVKVKLFKLIKSKKPSGIFINEYLTKTRSALLYKLRLFKRSNLDKIESVYSFNGVPCCKFKEGHNLNNNQIFYVKSESSYEYLVDRLNLSPDE